MKRLRSFLYVVPGLLLVLIGLLAAPSLVAHASTGAWSITGSMRTGRYFHTATVLPNGKMLVAGGRTLALAAPWRRQNSSRQVCPYRSTI